MAIVIEQNHAKSHSKDEFGPKRMNNPAKPRECPCVPARHIGLPLKASVEDGLA
jgi:hypothetical protein